MIRKLTVCEISFITAGNKLCFTLDELTAFLADTARFAAVSAALFVLDHPLKESDGRNMLPNFNVGGDIWPYYAIVLIPSSLDLACRIITIVT